MDNRETLVALRQNSNDLHALYQLLKNNEQGIRDCLMRYFPEVPVESMGVIVLRRVALAARSYSAKENPERWIASTLDWTCTEVVHEANTLKKIPARGVRG